MKLAHCVVINKDNDNNLHPTLHSIQGAKTLENMTYDLCMLTFYLLTKLQYHLDGGKTWIRLTHGFKQLKCVTFLPNMHDLSCSLEHEKISIRLMV